MSSPFTALDFYVAQFDLKGAFFFGALLITVYSVTLLLEAQRLSTKDALPAEPPYLPYTIPWLGHTLQFMRDSNNVFDLGRKYFDMGPFMLKIAGQKNYVFNHPRDAIAVLKATKSLSFDGAVAKNLKNIYGMFDEPDITVEEMLTGVERPNGSVMGNPHSFFRRELTGPSLQILTDRSLYEIQARLDREFSRLYALQAGPRGEDIGVLPWSRNLLGMSVTEATFGHRFCKRFPDILEHLWVMDDQVWKLMYELPKTVAPGVHASREVLVSYIRALLDDTSEGAYMREEALPIVIGREAEMAATGVSLDNRARGVLTILQAFHTNSAPSAFWMLTYICQTPGLLQRLRVEISPAWAITSAASMPQMDISYLNSTTTCPLLHSVYMEVLRVTSSTITVRKVVEETTIAGYDLHPGNMIFCPARPVQMSKEFWGDDAENFSPDRFMEKPMAGFGVTLKPFGAMSTICPGRFFAAAEIKAFIGSVLMRFDFTFKQGIPDVDGATPSFGIMRPKNPPLGIVRPRVEWAAMVAKAQDVSK